MFTGIVEQTARVSQAQLEDGYLRVTLKPAQMWSDLSRGESVACNGVCLTVVAWNETHFSVELSQETLAKTSARWQPGNLVNLERALRADDRLGGHFVSGHVDGIGAVLKLSEVPGAFTADIEVSTKLARYLVPKGSVTVDGVSLTVVAVGGAAGNTCELAQNQFRLWLVPHTLNVTSLSDWRAGTHVNVEADQLAKYLERLVALRETEVA